MKRLCLLALALCSVGLGAPLAQMRVVPIDEEQGHVALGLALRHLGNAGIFMQATAHPDDENNGLLVMLNRGLGFARRLPPPPAATVARTRLAPKSSRPWASSAPRSSPRFTASTAPNSTLPARSTSASRSVSRRPTKSGAATRSPPT